MPITSIHTDFLLTAEIDLDIRCLPIGPKDRIWILYFVFVKHLPTLTLPNFKTKSEEYDYCGFGGYTFTDYADGWTTELSTIATKVTFQML